LKYRLQTGPSVSYSAGASVQWTAADFDGELKDGVLVLTMKTHHATTGSAQEAVRSHLRAWEIQSNLDLGPDALRFEFDSAELIDRNPPPPGAPRVMQAEGGVFICMSGRASGHVTRAAYPPPPANFAASPTVMTLWQRYRSSCEGKEPLTSMGYFCLSVIQADAGGRRKAATKYQIAIDVLDKLGELTSEVGDEATARKLDQRSTFRPHTQGELNWIQEAVKRLVRRAGEIAANPTGPHVLVGMRDLPTV
jgi:hypothetical protein